MLFKEFAIKPMFLKTLGIFFLTPLEEDNHWPTMAGMWTD